MIQLLDHYEKLHIQLAITFFLLLLFIAAILIIDSIVFFNVGAYCCVFLGIFNCLAFSLIRQKCNFS